MPLRAELRAFWRSLELKLWGRNIEVGNPVEKSDENSVSWDAWELDPIFFQALSQWNKKNPERSFDRVIQKIRVAIETGENFLDLVPDSPFPARSLIKALAYLMKLGATVSKAQKDVYEFVTTVVKWVGDLQKMFKKRKLSPSMVKAWHNLAEMRKLIDELCTWAHARLVDGMWSRIIHGLSVEKEINEFKLRISETRAVFITLTITNVAENQDKMLSEIQELIKLIRDGRMSAAETRRQFLSQTLSKQAVTKTAYDEQGKNPCDTDTRVEILADIMKWVFDTSNSSQSFLWLTGDPGSGKSAITASMARDCKDAKVLWAQFFINRNLGYTTNPASYFPSIARQLAGCNSLVADAIHDALEEKPSLIDNISQAQAGKLFVDSLKVASAIDPLKPVVIIIDALDETDPSHLQSTAEIFSNALVDLPKNCKVFISSRTDDKITKSFSDVFKDDHAASVKQIHLNTSHESSQRDVSLYLIKKIHKLVEQNGKTWSDLSWSMQLETLCKQASGLFIWAVTALKFIEAEVEALGLDCLENVLDELNVKGMDDINVLYGTILRITYRNRTDPREFEMFRQIIGCIIVLQEPLCLADLKLLLNYQKSATTLPFDIEHFIRRLRTVLVTGTDAVGGNTVPRLHKSFFEFITGFHVDSKFCIQTKVAHVQVAMQCMHQLVVFGNQSTETVISLSGSLDSKFQSNSTYQDVVPRDLPIALCYARQFLAVHLSQINASQKIEVGLILVGLTNPPDLQQLFQLFSHEISDTHNPCVNITFSPNKNQVLSSGCNSIRIWNAQSGKWVEFSSTLEGHTGIVSSVAFSPDGQQVISGSNDHTLCLWNVQIGQLIGEPFKGHSLEVECVAFSPNGQQVISGSNDCSLCVWNAKTGQLGGKLLKGHGACVTSVAFSPDGQKIISGSENGILCLWSAKTGQLIHKSFEGHDGCVHSVAFSPDGQRIISGSADDTLCLWNATTGQLIGKPFKGHKDAVYSVAFSPDGSQIVSGSADKTLCLWSTKTHELVGEPFRGHYYAVKSVAFSPDGQQVLSGSADNTLCLWNVKTGQCIGKPFKAHTSQVTSVAFSPDGQQIVSGSFDKTICLWNVASRKPINFAFKHADRVTCTALSPSGRKIVSASSDNKVWVWDVETGKSLSHSPLGQDIKDVLYLAFSPDEDQIAALTLNHTIYIWDQNSKKCLVSYKQNDLNVQVPMDFKFSLDRKQLVSSCINGTTYTWDAMTGQNFLTSSTIALPDYTKPFPFSDTPGESSDNLNKTPLHWLPVDDPNYGLWICFDGKALRLDKSGSVAIFDVSKAVQSLMGSM